MNDAIRMQISAFVDGELPDAEADLLLRRMSQDAALRKQAAEFLEIGRAMRGEPGVPGVDRLQERISAELDDKPMVVDEALPEVPAGRRSAKPLVGVAVAASVALIAIFGLQLRPGVDVEAPAENTVADRIEDTAYTVPQPVDEQLQQFVLSHGASSSENSMNTRLVTLRLSEEALSEEALAEEEPEDEAVDDETADEAPTQP